MKKIYEVGGILNQGFVGQISYTICLDQEYQEMDIAFSFDKQRYEVITDELKKELIAACNGKYGADTASDKLITHTIKDMKTELQMIVTMNDTFIGGIHRQETSRHLYFSEHEATPGCIPQPSINGVIRITILAFSVIRDETHYALSLSVR
ncbi:MAG: DUF6669 family protein [Niameybacter sp.]|uniref:DUF6669 family protein n=1 Tax=Niameybacter sp. TaxID=2033640 RepID=UPI002FC5BD29